MKTEILLGDEAVALAAVHAGLASAYSYPGTPASEVMEHLLRLSGSAGGFRAAWSVNEKVAYEEALGVSFAGKRALVSMKHVGLNVAADPFMNSALVDIRGGLVVVVADDPGMHSSQNEQDSRYYAQFAQIFAFEPSDHQEAYDMTRQAFEVSEKFHIPVMVRMVTRLSHSRSGVKTGAAVKASPAETGDGRDWTLLPVNARRRFKRLLDSQPELVRFSNESRFNSLISARNKTRLGVIASGIGHKYVLENIEGRRDGLSLLKVSTYPLPEALVRRLVEASDTVLVVEEGYPFIEKQILGLLGVPDKEVWGKMSGHLPDSGELSPDAVRAALQFEPLGHQRLEGFTPAGRPPQLCAGCPHADTFRALNKALEAYESPTVFSDIGCYTLGALPPYEAIDTCVCMGASISMAKGAADAGLFPSVAVIGDSTFGHSGLTPLLDAAASDTPMTVIIVDNATVAMTGGQPSYASGDRLRRLVEGLGVDKERIRLITPLPKNLEENARLLREEVGHRGLSVVIAVRECVQESRKKSRLGS